MNNIDTTPRAWIGCLACYNNGKLIGKWYDAEEAEDVTPEDIHNSTYDSSHEELWVMDHENIPVKGEFSPMEAAEWGKLLAEVSDYERLAFLAWVEAGYYSPTGKNNLPEYSDFEEAYCGAWDSFEDYAHELADSIGLLNETPEEIASYFDWDSWARDLSFDYTVMDNPEGGVFVFRNY